MFEAGHPHKGMGEHGEGSRRHCSEDIMEWARIMAEEATLNGVVVLRTPYISVYADAEELDAAQAAEVVEALQIARLKLDEINGAKVRPGCPA